jgi:hypothetical protein
VWLINVRRSTQGNIEDTLASDNATQNRNANAQVLPRMSPCQVSVSSMRGGIGTMSPPGAAIVFVVPIMVERAGVLQDH